MVACIGMLHARDRAQVCLFSLVRAELPTPPMNLRSGLPRRVMSHWHATIMAAHSVSTRPMRNCSSCTKIDHAGAAAELRERTGVTVEGPHRDDQFWLDQITESSRRYNLPGGRNVTPDRYLEDGDELELEGVKFGVLHTPGHTPGHVVIHNTDAKIAFVGDVLFAGSIGRTDLPRGDHQQLINSITSKLWPLGDDITFVPGHGPTSTFGRERKSNPFVADQLTGYGGAKTAKPDDNAQKTSKRYS